MKATYGPKGLHLEMNLNAEAKASASGKTNTIGTFSGLCGATTKDGQPIRLTVTAYVYPEPRPTLNQRQTGVKCSVLPGKTKADPATLVMDVPAFAPRQSSTGKSMLLASVSGGTGFMLGEREVQLSLNAGFKP